MAGDHIEEGRSVGHVGGEGTDLVQRRSQRDQSVAADSAVGRLHPDNAAERRGLADGTAGV